MQMRKSVLVSILMLCLAGNLSAESVRRDGGGSDADQRTQLMLRQLTQAKARLEADNGKLAAEVQSLKEKLASAEKELGHTNNNLDKTMASNDKLVARGREDNQKMLALMEKYRDSVQLLRMEKANVELLKLAVDERNSWIDKCKANNEALYKLNLELVDRYQNKGLWQALTEAEPFTGISSVHLENIADDYRYKLEDLQVARFRGKQSDETHNE
jgi:hypothetical protein